MTIIDQPCRCGGAIKNCVYCQGSGYLNEANQQLAAQLIEQSRVMHCPACNLQNRVKESVLAAGEMPHCYGCQAELFNRSRSAFDSPLFRRK
jgi:hypothetical protein